jgi:hypothetical protein
MLNFAWLRLWEVSTPGGGSSGIILADEVPNWLQASDGPGLEAR